MSHHETEYIQTKLGRTHEMRYFVLSDAEALQKFFHQSALDSTHTLHYSESPIAIGRLQEKIKQALESPSELFIGVFDQDNIIGQLYFRISRPDHPWVKHIGEFGMTVLKQYWGQGIGSLLLRKMEAFAISSGVTRIEATVRGKNDRAIFLYKKFGYQIEGSRKCRIDQRII